MKTVYLHIGLHKTGTSSIQKFFSINKNDLLINHSIDYFVPCPWPIPFRSEPVIELDLSGLDYIKESSANKVVISHENYAWIFERDKITRLVEKLESLSDELKVILYFRRQDSLAISQKQEGTKWLDNSVAYGHDLSALPHELNYFSSNYLNFYEKAKMWSEVVGSENLILRLFDKDKLINGDVVEDFCSQVGIKNIEMYKQVGRVNESMSRKKQLFLHLTRKYFPESSSEKHALVERVLNMPINDNEKLLPSRKSAESFYNKFKESNKKLKEEFFPDLKGKLFSCDFSMYPENSNEIFSIDEREELYAFLIKSLLNENEVLREKESLDEIADWYRDLALQTATENLEVAYKLMKKAEALRPEGPFIKKKIKEFEKKLMLKEE